MTRGAILQPTEIGKAIVLRSGKYTIREIAELMGRSKTTIMKALKQAAANGDDRLEYDKRLQELTPVSINNVGQAMLSENERLRYEASRDHLRGTQYYKEQVNVNDMSARPTADLIQLLTDALSSIKSNTAIESTEVEYEVVTNDTETANKQATNSDQSTSE